jgi:hypothetical protein
VARAYKRAARRVRPARPELQGHLVVVGRGEAELEGRVPLARREGAGQRARQEMLAPQGRPERAQPGRAGPWWQVTAEPAPGAAAERVAAEEMRRERAEANHPTRAPPMGEPTTIRAPRRPEPHA